MSIGKLVPEQPHIFLRLLQGAGVLEGDEVLVNIDTVGVHAGYDPGLTVPTLKFCNSNALSIVERRVVGVGGVFPTTVVIDANVMVPRYGNLRQIKNLLVHINGNAHVSQVAETEYLYA